jgi:ElaB/YqjD/DUF883 family membrane-anchored ribosome-binding protein
MKHAILKMGMLAAVLGAFTVGAAAQHEEHHPQSQTNQPLAQNVPTPAPSQSGMMNGGKMADGMMGMMMNMMMGQVDQMMTQHQQMNDTMNKLMQSMAAIESEKDPAALKTKIAEHRALMEQMRGQMMQQGGMMQMMMGGMGAPAADNAKQPTK